MIPSQLSKYRRPATLAKICIVLIIVVCIAKKEFTAIHSLRFSDEIVVPKIAFDLGDTHQTNDKNHSETSGGITHENKLTSIDFDASRSDSKGSETSTYWHTIPDVKRPSFLRGTDLIFSSSGQNVPIVNEEYRTVFFPIAKCGSTEFKRFFLRLQGAENWCEPCIHTKYDNGLRLLNDYNIEEAQEMMTSPGWNRAVFIRSPKPRLLSAFLDKAIKNKKFFIKKFCPQWAKDKTVKENGGSLEECAEKHDSFEFFLHNITTTISNNGHWRTIHSMVDKKWWPYMTHIAHMEDLSGGAERFLKSIYSKFDNVTAWDRIGRTGWGAKEGDCDNIGNETFLAKRPSEHKTNAKDKMLQYYTPELERFVDEHFEDDINNPFFHFNKLTLFPQDEENATKSDR